MRQKVLFTILLVFGFATLNKVAADPVTRQQARQNVQAFLEKKGKKVSSVIMYDVTLGTSNNESYYIFNVGRNGGFVIASGDDCAPSILGYSSKGALAVETIPDNMKAWLQGYADQIAYMKANHLSYRGATRGADHAKIAPLLTTIWSQNEPFNNKCPDFFNYGKSVTGCVATAMAQVLYYHRATSTRQLLDDIPAYQCFTNWNGLGQISVDGFPAGSVIDWDNMLDDYGYGVTATEEQQTAVANLMAYCGASVEMNYSTGANGGSGASSDYVPGALKKYFGYSKDTYLEKRANYTDEEWDELVYSELSKGNPVYYSGSTSSGSGHAFVCDGYDGDGYYHINWGWGGLSDSNFLLSALDPDVQGIGGSDAGYNYNQDALIGAVPRDLSIVDPEAYAVFEDGVLTFYCDNDRATRSGTTYDLNDGYGYPGWNFEKVGDNQYNPAKAQTITKVVFDPSFASATPSTTSYWFAYCNYMTAIEGLRYLNTKYVENMAGMFMYCFNLPSIDLSNFDTRNVADFQNMLIYCWNLKTLDLSHFITRKGSMFHMLRECSGLTEVKLPADLRTISESQLANCTSLTSVTIPCSVTSIGENAFNGCEKLALVESEITTPFAIEDNVFSGIASDAILRVPRGTASAYQALSGWSQFFSAIEENKGTGLYQTPVFVENGTYDFKYRLNNNSPGLMEVRVRVARYMGWKGLNRSNRELGRYVFAGPPAAHSNYPVWNVDATNHLAYDMEVADNKQVVTVGATDYDVAYQIVALADKDPDQVLCRRTFVKPKSTTPHEIRNNHLYETVGYFDNNVQSRDANYENQRFNDVKCYGAIPMPATHCVLYNGEIDLIPYLEIHYNCINKYGEDIYDAVMTDDLRKQLGLEYHFSIVDYSVGEEITSQSAHIVQVDGKAPGSRFIPCSVDMNGEPIFGMPATREVVDREPLVRVDLLDAEGNIIKYGYIKLRIVCLPEEFGTVELENDMEVDVVMDSDLYMNPGDEVKTTWAQIENLILSKLGNAGITKKEFEENFKLDVYGDYKYMPCIDPMLFDQANVDLPGSLYTKTWQAKRYCKKNGAYVAAMDEDNGLGKWTRSDNHFGEVWYTPHDYASVDREWDEKTNSLVWNFYPGDGADARSSRTLYVATPLSKDQAGNMDVAKYRQLMVVADVLPETKGMNTKEVSTVVRFINKSTGHSIWVTLIIPRGKFQFEYGKVTNKNWSDWFEFNSAQAGYQADVQPYWSEFDVHANPLKPSNVDYRYLNVEDFNVLLTNFWMDPANMIKYQGGANRFTRFEGYNRWQSNIIFEFTAPRAGVNSATMNSASDGSWVLTGASGTKWTLRVGSHSLASYSSGTDAIWVVKKNGEKYYEEVAYLDMNDANTWTNNIQLHYYGIEGDANLHPAATDLVNLMGAYDAEGKPNFETSAEGLSNMTSAYFFEDNQDRAFTAYLRIRVDHPGYEPLLTNSYFNVRFHRPINIVAKEYDWNNREQGDNFIDVKDLVEVVDWNNMAVVPFNCPAISSSKSKTGIYFPAYATVYEGPNTVKSQNSGIPYEYYGIQELAIRYGEIRTDLSMSLSDRRNLSATLSDLTNKTEKISNIPTLSNMVTADYKTFTLLNADGTVVGWEANDYNLSNYNAEAPGETSFGRIYFNSEGLGSELFHIFLPIAVKYNWGSIAYDKKLDAEGVKFDKDYTQVVWAVITVNAADDTFILGDANGDTFVDVSDVVITVDEILQRHPAMFDFQAADVNKDEVIDVSDVVGIVNLILHSAEAGARLKSQAQAADVENDYLTFMQNDNETVSLSLGNQGQYVAAQFDVRLSEGQTIESIRLNNGRKDGHQLSYQPIDDHLYRVIVFGLSNRPFKGHEGELVNIRTSGGTGNMTIDNIRFITNQQTVKQFEALYLGSTGMAGVRQFPAADIFTTDGRLVRRQVTTTDGLEKGVYIINKHKTIVK